MAQSTKVGSKTLSSMAEESGGQKRMTSMMESIRTIKSTEKAPTRGVMGLPSLATFMKIKIPEKDHMPLPKKRSFSLKLLLKGNLLRESLVFSLR